MGKRFGDIENAGVLKIALDNLTKYRADAATRLSPQITGSGIPKNRIQVKVGIVPFESAATAETITSGAAQYIVGMAKAAVDSAENFGKAVTSGYYDATPKTLATPSPKGFSPSRVRIFNPTSETAKYTKSKFTGLYYAKREGVGVSTPIGRKALGDAEESTQKAILSALTTEINAEPYRRVNFTDEKAPGLG